MTGGVRVLLDPLPGAARNGEERSRPKPTGTTAFIKFIIDDPTSYVIIVTTCSFVVGFGCAYGE